jgi:outer membrane protein assembly factor BamB
MYTPCNQTTCVPSFRGTPAVDRSTAYAVWGKGNISAVDIATGKEKWKVSVGNLPLYTPIINNNTLYITTLNHEEKPNNNYIYALDAQTGQKKWEYSITPRLNGLGNSILNSPSVYDGLLYFGTDAGILYALQ